MGMGFVERLSGVVVERNQGVVIVRVRRKHILLHNIMLSTDSTDSTCTNNPYYYTQYPVLH